jgi:hypothetical protein
METPCVRSLALQWHNLKTMFHRAKLRLVAIAVAVAPAHGNAEENLRWIQVPRFGVQLKVPSDTKLIKNAKLDETTAHLTNGVFKLNLFIVDGFSAGSAAEERERLESEPGFTKFTKIELGERTWRFEYETVQGFAGTVSRIAPGRPLDCGVHRVSPALAAAVATACASAVPETRQIVAPNPTKPAAPRNADAPAELDWGRFSGTIEHGDSCPAGSEIDVCVLPTTGARRCQRTEDGRFALAVPAGRYQLLAVCEQLIAEYVGMLDIAPRERLDGLTLDLRQHGVVGLRLELPPDAEDEELEIFSDPPSNDLARNYHHHKPGGELSIPIGPMPLGDVHLWARGRCLSGDLRVTLTKARLVKPATMHLVKLPCDAHR